MGGNSLIDLRGVSKPATVLIEKISAAVGGLFEPYQIVRIAKAEAAAELILAEANIEARELRRRAIQRFAREEAIHQLNMEAIASKSIPLVSEHADPSAISDDWIAAFFQRSRIISDEDMQGVWAHLLAREANRAGSVSRRTINLLGDLEKSDAEQFATLCRFCWVVDDNVAPVILDHGNAPPYEGYDLKFGTLIHLESLGLIRHDANATFGFTEMPDTFEVSYWGRSLMLNAGPFRTIEVGNVLLTKAGAELCGACPVEPVEGFFEWVRDRWTLEGRISQTPDSEAKDQ